MQEDQGSGDGQRPEVPGPESGAADPGRQPSEGQSGRGDQPAPGGYGQGSQPGHQGAYGQPGQPSPGGYVPPGYGQPGPSGYPGGFSQPGPSGYPGGFSQPGPSGYPGGFSQPGPSGYPGGFSQPAYGQPGYGQPGYGQPGYGQPAYGQPGGHLSPSDVRRRRRRSVVAYIAVAAVAAATGAGAVLALHHSPAARHSVSGNQGTGTAGRGDSSATEQAVVDAVQPGLVDISSSLGYQGGAAAATGMVISSNGLVLTNNHVITDTTGLVATVVSTGRKFQAKWLGYDSAADVAVIQLVGAHGLKTIPIGDSAQVKLGDNVIALGNAEGAGGAPAVVGTITGLNRTITARDSGAGTSETLHGMLQTDAGIVPGDSGGALASTAGKVIGMNTAAASGSLGDGTQNVGFAIPIDNALAIANRIIHGQSSPTIQIGSTGFMGVLVPAGNASQSTKPAEQRRLQAQQDGSAFASGTACLRNQLGAGVPAHVAPARTGALIIGDICGTPAAKAAIIAGDVITSVGGHLVTSPKELTSIMLGFKPGVTVPVIWIDVSGQTHRSALLLAQAPPR